MKRFAVTNGSLQRGEDGPDLDRLTARCLELASAGVDFLLVREKQLSHSDLCFVVRQIIEAVSQTSTLVLVAGTPEVARMAGAAGLHVGSDSGRIRPAKSALPGSYVSVSCHNMAEVNLAREAGADLCLFGPVFGKVVNEVEVVPGIGLGALQAACALAGDTLPVYALGGVTMAHAAACEEAGATGVAGIRLFFG